MTFDEFRAHMDGLPRIHGPIEPVILLRCYGCDMDKAAEFFARDKRCTKRGERAYVCSRCLDKTQRYAGEAPRD